MTDPIDTITISLAELGQIVDALRRDRDASGVTNPSHVESRLRTAFEGVTDSTATATVDLPVVSDMTDDDIDAIDSRRRHASRGAALLRRAHARRRGPTETAVRVMGHASITIALDLYGHLLSGRFAAFPMHIACRRYFRCPYARLNAVRPSAARCTRTLFAPIP
jgi:hypothetical protein